MLKEIFDTLSQRGVNKEERKIILYKREFIQELIKVIYIHIYGLNLIHFTIRIILLLHCIYTSYFKFMSKLNFVRH